MLHPPRPIGPRPAAALHPRPRRTGLVALAALAALAGCTGGQEIPACPGTEVATFALVATRTAASCQGDTVPADGTAACAAAVPPVTVDCQATRPAPSCCFDRLFPPSRPLTATIAYGAQDLSAAFCLARAGASPYLGTRAAAAGGEIIDVALDTTGAVLTSCAAACAVTVHHEVTGLVARDAAGAATGFSGQAVETASATPSATCAPCSAPCQATWSLAQP